MYAIVALIVLNVYAALATAFVSYRMIRRFDVDQFVNHVVPNESLAFIYVPMYVVKCCILPLRPAMMKSFIAVTQREFMDRPSKKSFESICKKHGAM